ncbi:hypothetical protein RRF57_010913 [Xylaria bambusicola]|uniref:Uncharacterized protein n=1 Tax=Xylaria bambusicola TaxID=326684 RepID=A0AAN7UYS4_9PEZI
MGGMKSQSRIQKTGGGILKSSPNRPVVTLRLGNALQRSKYHWTQTSKAWKSSSAIINNPYPGS